MKKIIVFIICFLAFIPSSFADFLENLDNAAREFIFPDEHNYNTGVKSYEEEEYLDAIEHFLSVDCNEKKTELCFKTSHNLGNSLYYFSFGVTDEVRVKNYEKAINYYNKALNIKEDVETRKNKEFLEEELKKLKKKLEEKKKIEQQQQSQGGGKSGEKNNSGNSGKSHPKTGEGDKEQFNKNNMPELNPNGEEKSAPTEEVPDYVNEDRIGEDLNEEEIKSMQDRLDYLKKDSTNNSRSFDKKKNMNDVRNKFFSDFESEFGFGIHKNEEKDW
ncbi:MAG: hypothetical protein N4A38_02915 [Candidatus Gracilibacteria bacterium]|nr:hypothetical protein [Candidatus Gracilibacteria bacterium]